MQFLTLLTSLMTNWFNYMFI